MHLDLVKERERCLRISRRPDRMAVPSAERASNLSPPEENQFALIGWPQTWTTEDLSVDRFLIYWPPTLQCCLRLRGAFSRQEP